MGFIDNIKSFFRTPETPTAVVKQQPTAVLHGTYRDVYTMSYNGEKNLGELGPIRDYKMDYEALRLSSWQAMLESEIAQTVLRKHTQWVIGSGLRLQCEPIDTVLKSEGIKMNRQDFNDVVESRWFLFSKDLDVDYAKKKTLNELQRLAFFESIVGGDVLTILRYKNNKLSVQLVDGQHVKSPQIGNGSYVEAKSRGNEIRNGIELSPTGEHVAYYICTSFFKYERVQARNSLGLKQAYLVCGSEHRMDGQRGAPVLSCVLETLKKLERYKEATVGSAEERQKIVMQIVHQEFSTNENPLKGQLAKAFNADSVEADIPEDIEGNKLANTVAASTNKQVFNMPNGAELRGLESKNELYFKDFYTINIEHVCATLGIPPDVALSKYNGSYSASRAAIKDWEHTLMVNRSLFYSAFLQPIYDYWLYTEILKNKIQAPGFLSAMASNNSDVILSYTNVRFVGAPVPHIDPEKEVRAERLKLGASADNIPLTTVEKATEALNCGDSDENMEQFERELKDAIKRKVAPDLGSVKKENNTVDE